MTWQTHIAFGISALWLMTPVPPDLLGYDFGTLAACAALGALLPDLDASEAKIKHLKLLGTNITPFFLPSQVVHRSDRHRGLLHSLVGLGMVAGMTAPLCWWVGWTPVIALVLGYASHLAADACTRSGISFLFPSRRRYHVLPRGFRVTTGSQAEDVLFALCSVFAMALLLKHLYC